MTRPFHRFLSLMTMIVRIPGRPARPTLAVLGVVFSALLATLLASCGGKSAPASAPAQPASSASESSPTVRAPASSTARVTAYARRPGHLPRSEVVAVLSRGLGDFLTRLDVQPVVVGGRFHGWKIVKLRADDPLWQGSELSPGDVVTRVNGASIERPEQAFSVFQTLAVANELRVEYERANARRQLVYAIDDAS